MSIFLQNKVALRLQNLKAELPDLSCLYWTYTWYSLGSVKIPWGIYCPMHPALSSILLLLKSIFWNTKMPAEIQMRKHGKTIKTRRVVPSNVSKRTQVTRHSLTDDTHKLSSGETITCIQISNRTCQKLASSYEIRTKEKIPSAAPSATWMWWLP